MADPKKGLKIGGISLGTIALAAGLLWSISDRAKESGVEDATLKMQVEANAKKIVSEVGAVSTRVDHLETHAGETEDVLNGKDGLISTVEVIKTKLESIGKQGDALGEQNRLILQKLDDLKK